MIESERTVSGKGTTFDGQWYISSRQASAEYLLAARRAHWQVENGLHWVLDVAFGEDESRVRKGEGAENVSVLRRMAVNLLEGEKTEERRRRRAGWRPNAAAPAGTRSTC